MFIVTSLLFLIVLVLVVIMSMVVVGFRDVLTMLGAIYAEVKDDAEEG